MEKCKVSIITGRSGFGKTTYCINSMADFIKKRNAEGKTFEKAFLIVPEQQSVVAEKTFLEKSGMKGLLGDEVIGFKRAVYRVLGRTGGLKYELLSSSGKIMVLTKVMCALEKKLDAFSFYVADPSGIDKIMRIIEEFGRYRVTPEMLRNTAEEYKNDGTDFSKRIAELALIFEAYRKEIEGYFYDSETVCEDMISEIAGDSFFRGAHVWIDGFSGFTDIEQDIILAMSDVCSEINITLCYDSSRNILFESVANEITSLKDKFQKKGINAERISLAQSEKYRFANCPALACLEQHYGSVDSGSHNISGDSIIVCKYNDRYHEAIGCAGKIKELNAKGIKNDEILVLTGDIDKYDNDIANVFRREKIRYFFDRKRSITEHSIAQAVISLLNIAAYGWRTKNVMAFLKSGIYYDDTDTIDALENLVIKRGIDAARGKKTWKYFAEKYPKEDYCNKRIAFVVTRLYEDVTAFSDAIKTADNIEDCALQIMSFLNKCKAYKNVSGISQNLSKNCFDDEANEYNAVWNTVAEIINDIRRILGTSVIKGKKNKCVFLRNLFENAFSQYRTGLIPHSQDCVRIGTPERSEKANPKAVIVIGMNEGIFPGKIDNNGILTDRERLVMKDKGIRLADDSVAKAFYFEYVIYTVLSAPSEYLYMSYTSSGEDRQPSRVISSIRRIFSDLEVQCDNTNDINLLSSQDIFDIPVNVSPAVSNALLKFDQSNPTQSVSSLESYAECPYSYFLERGLRLDERQEAKIRDNDLGNIMHLFFEKTVKKASENNGFTTEISADDCKKIVDEAYGDVISEIEAADRDHREIYTENDRNQYIAEKIKNIAGEQLLIISKQFAENHLAPIAFEQKYGFGDEDSFPPVEIVTDDGFKVLLNGKIDRIDAAVFSNEEDKVYFRVVDYKKGKYKDADYASLLFGTEIQLLTYIKAVKLGIVKLDAYDGKTPIPLAAIYHKFSTRESEMFKGYFAGESDRYCPDANKIAKKDGIPSGGFEHLEEEVEETIKKKIAAIKNGDFPIKPYSSNNSLIDDKNGPQIHCKYCNYREVCRINADNERKHKVIKEKISEKDFWDNITEADEI